MKECWDGSLVAFMFIAILLSLRLGEVSAQCSEVSRHEFCVGINDLSSYCKVEKAIPVCHGGDQSCTCDDIGEGSTTEDSPTGNPDTEQESSNSDQGLSLGSYYDSSFPPPPPHPAFTIESDASSKDTVGNDPSQSGLRFEGMNDIFTAGVVEPSLSSSPAPQPDVSGASADGDANPDSVQQNFNTIQTVEVISEKPSDPQEVVSSQQEGSGSSTINDSNVVLIESSDGNLPEGHTTPRPFLRPDNSRRNPEGSITPGTRESRTGVSFEPPKLRTAFRGST